MDEALIDFLKNPIVGRAVIIIVGILLIWILVKFLQKKLFRKIESNQSRYKAIKISSFAGYILTIILIIFVFSDKLTGLSTALGVAGAGIAFALQEVIVSFAGWLSIVFGAFYKTGDRIKLGGITGDVMDIGVLRTTIMETGEWVDGDLYNGRIVFIANSFVFKEPVFNYSGDFPFLWDEIKIAIAFGSDYQLASDIILNAGKTVAGDLSKRSFDGWKKLQRYYRLEDAKTHSMVSVATNDSFVEYTLRYVVDYQRRRITKSELYNKILQDIEATKGKVYFNYPSLQLVGVPDLKVKMDEKANREK